MFSLSSKNEEYGTTVNLATHGCTLKLTARAKSALIKESRWPCKIDGAKYLALLDENLTLYWLQYKVRAIGTVCPIFLQMLYFLPAFYL